MLHSILVHWKAEVAISSVVIGIGLLANEVTAPKVLAAMVFLSDWSMAGTWPWLIRTAVYLMATAMLWLWQKRKYERRLAVSEFDLEKRIFAVTAELKHAQILLSAAQTRIDVLTAREAK